MGGRPSISQGSWSLHQSGAEEEEAHSSEQYWKAEETGLWVGASPTWTVPGEAAGWFYMPLWTSQARKRHRTRA